MKVYGQILTLSLFHATAWETIAFSLGRASTSRGKPYFAYLGNLDGGGAKSQSMVPERDGESRLNALEKKLEARLASLEEKGERPMRPPPPGPGTKTYEPLGPNVIPAQPDYMAPNPSHYSSLVPTEGIVSAPVMDLPPTQVLALSTSETVSDLPMFPIDPTLERLEGGNTVRTYKIPGWATRVQYILKTEGRPLKANVGLWLGPLRQTHNMDIDVEDGSLTPFRATLKFKKGPPMLKIITSPDLEFPVLVGAVAPATERAKELEKYTEKLWKTCPKTRIQGGTIGKGGKSVGGAVRYFPIDGSIGAVQCVFWTADTSKKSFKAKIEVLQGPNNPKQSYDLQCGGGSQPYHCVIETPGEGCVLRMQNKKFLEDGLFEVAVVPYMFGDEGAPFEPIKPM